MDRNGKTEAGVEAPDASRLISLAIEGGAQPYPHETSRRRESVAA